METDFVAETENAGFTGRLFGECEKYHQPVIALDSRLNIIYKNSPAKILNLKPRLNISISRYIDEENAKKLADSIENNEFKIITLDVVSPFKRCVSQPHDKNFTLLVFYDALNFFADDPDVSDNINKTEKIEDIISVYNCERKKNAAKNPGLLCSDSNIDHDAFRENNRNLTKINDHFRRHMINLPPENLLKNPARKNYREIKPLLNRFSAAISQYISPFGYKITFNIEDKMFLYDLNEEDFLLINFILSAAALKYSVFNKADVTFHSDYSPDISGILRYEFRVGGDFAETHGDMFACDYINEIKNTDYIDFNLAALVAKNNGLKLRVYFNPDAGGGNVCFDLIFRVKHRDDKDKDMTESPFGGDYMPEITPTEIISLAETELSGIFGEEI